MDLIANNWILIEADVPVAIHLEWGKENLFFINWDLVTKIADGSIEGRLEFKSFVKRNVSPEESTEIIHKIEGKFPVKSVSENKYNNFVKSLIGIVK